MLTIILLGVRQTGARSSQETDCRCEKAADIYHQAQGARIIACGGALPGDDESEAGVLYRRLRRLGVDDADILIEDQSRTTMENLIRAAAIMKEDGGEAVVVTSDYHRPRVRLIAKRRGLALRVVGARIPLSPYKARRMLMEIPYALDILLGHQDPGANRPAWTRLIMKLLRQDKP